MSDKEQYKKWFELTWKGWEPIPTFRFTPREITTTGTGPFPPIPTIYEEVPLKYTDKSEQIRIESTPEGVSLDIHVFKALEIIGIQTSLFEEDLADELMKRKFDYPIKSGTDFYKGYVIDTFECPDCSAPVGDEIHMFKFCPNCGKRIRKE